MEQELINTLNERIIVQFEEKEKDLKLKIESLEEVLNNANLTEDLLEEIRISIENMKKAKQSISNQIKRMKEKRSKGISLIKNVDRRYKNIFTDSKYSGFYDFEDGRNKNVSENIERLEKITANMNDKSKLEKKVKNSLEKRISRLKDKKGRIQNRQTRIVDFAVKERLNSYLKDVKKMSFVSSAVVKTSEKSKKYQEEIDKLTEEKERISSIKTQLLSGGLLDKGPGVKMYFREGLTEGRIQALKAKKGMVDYVKKQTVITGVTPSIIEIMKKGVASLKTVITNAYDNGVAIGQEFLELEQPKKSR